MFRCKKTLLLEPLLELLELLHQVACTCQFKVPDHQLILSAFRVDGDRALRADLQAIFQHEFRGELGAGARKKNSVQQSPGVFECKVTVPTRIGFEARELPLYADRTERGFNRRTDALRQFGNGEGFEGLMHESVTP